MGLKYQENVTIPFDMCDVQHEIKLPAFISYCLGVSGRQSESVGRSDVFIFEEFGLIWVVTDYELNIHRLPTYNETITIVTEAIAYNKFFCHRMFYIYDENGNLLLDILCYFVLIDFETRKVAPVPEVLIEPFQSEQVKYLEWMCESLGYDFLLCHVPKKIQLKYIKEVAPTSQVSSRLVTTALHSQHEIVVEGHIHAQATIEWRKRDDAR